MSDRRSSRTRKQIDYSKFSVVSTDDDDGDDFVDDCTPPPPQKRAKKEAKPRKNAQLKTVATAKEGKRRSLDEKLFTRDLQLALEKSAANNELKSPNCGASKTSSLGEQLGPEKVAVEKGENGGAVHGKQRQAAAKATLKIAEGSPQGLDVQTINLADKDDDEEYSVEKEVISDMSSGDEDCEESDEVSDFEDTIKRPTKKKTSERSTRKAKTTSSIEGKPAKKTSRPPAKAKSNVPLTPRTGASIGDSSHIEHILKTQPPAWRQVPQLSAKSCKSSVGGATSLRSPCGSTLRLGLSRRANVKPLHVMAKVTQQT